MARSVSSRARIALPIEACWERLRDLTRAVEYVPGLTGCRIVSDTREGLGACRIVSHAQFGDMQETVVEWNHGEGFEIRLHKGDHPPAPFAESRFRYRLIAEGPNSTLIETSMTYALAWGPIGWALDQLAVRWVMARNVRDVAVCLAESYETKSPVPPGRLQELRSRAL